MTLQERYDAKKAEAVTLGQQLQQAQGHLGQLQQAMIRIDAEMALLEDLLKPQAASESTTSEPLPFAPKKRRGPKPESAA